MSDAAAAAEVLPQGSVSDVIVFVIGSIPFLWATWEFWRRIAVGLPFGTGSDSVVFPQQVCPRRCTGCTSAAVFAPSCTFAAEWVRSRQPHSLRIRHDHSLSTTNDSVCRPPLEKMTTRRPAEAGAHSVLGRCSQHTAYLLRWVLLSSFVGYLSIKRILRPSEPAFCVPLATQPLAALQSFVSKVIAASKRAPLPVLAVHQLEDSIPRTRKYSNLV